MRIETKFKVFILGDYYLPGYKAGGPIRTLANLVERLGDRFDFRLFTRDRDFGDQEPYSQVQVNVWNRLGNAQVYYASPDQFTSAILRRLIRASNPDVVYLNSFFSPITVKVLMLFRFNLLPRIPVLLAPRGEFSPAALRLKSAKKQAYLVAARSSGLLRAILWQASSEFEAADIRRVLGERCQIQVAPNLPPRVDNHAGKLPAKAAKHPGSVRLVFLSRIAPMKNLAQALEMVSRLSTPVVFDIYGPMPRTEDAYWRNCQELIAHVPPNIHIRYHGPVPNHEVINTLAQYHFLLLPTRGENFGHIILEAMVAGCPVLLSDRTQWLDLADKRVGWDLPLEDRERWHTVLQQCVAMDDTEYRSLSQSTRRFALDYIASPVAEKQNIELFHTALRLQSSTVI